MASSSPSDRMTPNPNPSPELLPCPFCGSAGKHHVNDRYEYVQCTNAECLLIPSTNWRLVEKAEAITAWQTRALSPQTLPAPGEVEAGQVVLEGRGDGTYAEAERAICGLIALVTQRRADGDRIAVAKALASHPDSSWDDYEWEDMASYVRERFLEQADLAIASLATVAAANDEGVVDYPDELLDRVAEAITRAQCPGREGPYGGYDYGHRHEDDLPRDGRYVVRDFRDVSSDTFGAWVHQTPDVEVHEAAFDRLTKRHIARAALDAAAPLATSRSQHEGAGR